MDRVHIVEKNVIASKERIQKAMLKDVLLIFLYRLYEDLSENPNVSVKSRARTLYTFLQPYHAYDEAEVLLFLQNAETGLFGLLLSDEERHLLSVIFSEVQQDFRFLHGAVMKGRIKGMLKKLCKTYLPQSSSIIEPLILCRLISAVGGIARFKNLPGSTIQLLGAEEALFRHKVHGNRPPKYGLLYYSKFVQQEHDKGKAARQLAHKLAITAKVDYFQHFHTH